MIEELKAQNEKLKQEEQRAAKLQIELAKIKQINNNLEEQNYKYERNSEFIKNFCDYFYEILKNNSFVRYTIRPIASYLIQRYFCRINMISFLFSNFIDFINISLADY